MKKLEKNDAEKILIEIITHQRKKKKRGKKKKALYIADDAGFAGLQRLCVLAPGSPKMTVLSPVCPWAQSFCGKDEPADAVNFLHRNVCRANPSPRGGFQGHQ